MPPPTDPSLGEEIIPSDEAALIDALLAIQGFVQQQLDQRRPHATRGQHPKQHGCVRAEWIVAEDLAETIRRVLPH